MSKISDNRKQVSDNIIYKAMEQVRKKLQYRLDQKGHGSFASSHEILGILIEEMTELTEEIHKNSDKKYLIAELLDVAVAAVMGIASIESGGCDW